MRKLLKQYRGYQTVPMGAKYVIPVTSSNPPPDSIRFHTSKNAGGHVCTLQDPKICIMTRGFNEAAMTNWTVWTIEETNKRIKLTKAILEEKRKELEFCDFLICDNTEKQWRIKAGGTISNPDKASYYRMADMEKIVEGEGKGKDGVTVYYIEGSDWSKPRCKVEEALSSTVIELLQLAPVNPTARSLAMSQIKQNLPDEADTWEKIKQWVEFNIRPSIKINNSPDTANRGEVLRVPCFVSYQQSGTRYYTQDVTESCEFSLTADRLSAFLAGRRNVPVAQVIDYIKEKATEYAEEDLGEGDVDYGDCDYGDMIESNNENVVTSLRSTDEQIKAMLEEWINNHPDYRPLTNLDLA